MLIIPVLRKKVGGATHMTADSKDTVTFSLTLDAVDTNMPIDLTVVVSNPPSIYYYGQLLVNAIEPTATAAPSTSVTTLAPSATAGAPTLTPTVDSTALPSPVPVATPTAIPSTGLPSASPSLLPTALLSESPALAPSTMLPMFTPTLGPLPNLYELGIQRNLTFSAFLGA
jgi:hypothetical protein